MPFSNAFSLCFHYLQVAEELLLKGSMGGLARFIFATFRRNPRRGGERSQSTQQMQTIIQQNGANQLGLWCIRRLRPPLIHAENADYHPTEWG